MTAFSCILIGLGLGMALDQWLQRHRRLTWDEATLADTEETLELTRVDLHNARAEKLASDAYAARLIEDPAFYFEQRNRPPKKSRV